MRILSPAVQTKTFRTDRQTLETAETETYRSLIGRSGQPLKTRQTESVKTRQVSGLRVRL